MAKLGDRVTFTAPLLHHTQTVKDGKVIGGSIYCVDQYEFAGIVGRIYDAPSPTGPDNPAIEEEETAASPRSPSTTQVADLFLLVPGKTGQWVKGISEGNEAGEFRVVP